MIELWMKKPLESDNNCNIINIECFVCLQGLSKNVRFTFSVGDTARAIYD